MSDSKHATTRKATMVDFVEMLENEEKILGGRLTDYKPAKSKRENLE